MRFHLPTALILLASLAQPHAQAADTHPALELKNGDRIVLIGDTLIERDQRYGYVETLITLQNPNKDLTFRNLGWSGDTVAGLSRAGFDPPAAGFTQLINEVHAAKPTVLIVGYGMAESFDGPPGLPRFTDGLSTLLHSLEDTKARVLLLSPIAQAKLAGTSPNPDAHNASLELFTKAIATAAQSSGLPFIDLFHPFLTRYQTADISDNGIHLNDRGYRVLASQILVGISPGKPLAPIQLTLDASAKLQIASAAKIDQLEPLTPGIRFRLTPDHLPLTLDPPNGQPLQTEILLQITGLPAGNYELLRDGQPVTTKTAQSWGDGVRSVGGPDHDQAVQLRHAINRKNQLFFDRWRPQNITYLFGFRKHEQGQNAIEIPQFDPLVADQEAVIAKLRKPTPRIFELTRVEREVSR